ncbi:MAG TPA: C1 family peptidase, partial [Longimicrobium sp.]|nr:C1 family peptidase [Longimicrobium sp.]
LLEYAPRRLSQGSQGSCVGWASSYAARTILYARQTGKPPDQVAFSPAFLYNQIALENCDGTYLKRAMEVLERTGDLPLGDFAYDPRTCERRPSATEKSRAGAFRIAGYTRLSIDADDYRTNADALKQNLAQGAPVVIGMRVGGSFTRGMQGKRLWTPTRADYAAVESWGGHAMAVIGYDDTLEGGAFQLMNSWGDDWGEGGVAWVRYRDFDHFVKEAYGLYPMGAAKRETEEQRIRFGLVGAQDFKRLPLSRVDDLTYRTASPIRKGSRFKVEFSNARPVYTYLFGQETDGSSYVLFPYTEKHSPYCGTTGTRIFPRKQSLTADELGTRDSIAVVISPKPLDFKALNDRISSQPGEGYAARLRAALGESLDGAARVRARDQLIELSSAQLAPDKVNALVIEFDKR